MAIFKKLNIGDVVATSGTRVFKKLTTGEPLPIWDGTDLYGTTWYLRDDWTAEAGYGVFDAGGAISIASGAIAIPSKICIGYSPESAGSENLLPTSDSISVQYNAPDKFYRLESITRMTFFGSGTDMTNPRLINWLLKNAKLTSHRLVINGTYLFNETITELPIVYADGVNISNQSAFNVVFYIGTSPSAGLFCMQEADGITLHPMPTLSVYYLYDFRTNTWRKDELRCFTFNNATAKNDIGEDVTQVLLWWIVTNATKQDSL